MPLVTTARKQVHADRIKWKLGPSFDPVPYLPASEWPNRPRALVHCSRDELLKLAGKGDVMAIHQSFMISRYLYAWLHWLRVMVWLLKLHNNHSILFFKLWLVACVKMKL